MAAKSKSKARPAGDPVAFAQAAECLKTLAHPVRLRFVQLLLHGRYTVGELAAIRASRIMWPPNISD